MQSNNQSQLPVCTMIPLGDFGNLQVRYQALKMTQRAQSLLVDAEPALDLAERTLRDLSGKAAIRQVFEKIRKNALITGKMRPSEARDMMLDASVDFVDGTIHKLAAWRKTIARISGGEGISVENGKEFIPTKNPLALAIAGTSGLSNYLSIVQLALMELAKSDKANADDHRTTISKIRRCATILGDYENAAGIAGLVH